MTSPTCANPDCNQPPRHTTGRGRPPIYCSPACRTHTARRPDRGPISVEVTHPQPDQRQRPTGRVWTVQLRRGPRTVTIADDLGHASAQHLATQIADLLHTSPHQGAAID